MAMRRFVQFSYSFEKKIVRLFAKATIGASGAITLSKSGNDSQGIRSITKLATAGQYRVTLEDSYYKLLKATISTQNATGISASGSTGILVSGTNVQTIGGGTVVLQMSTGGTATNPASGDVLYFEIVLGDSNV